MKGSIQKRVVKERLYAGDKLCNSPPVYNFSLTPYLRVSRSLRTADVSPSSSPLRGVCYLSLPSLRFIFHLFNFINFTKTMRTNLAPRLMGIKYLRNHIDILTFLSFVLFPYNLGAKYQFQSVIQERLRHNKKWP